MLVFYCVICAITGFLSLLTGTSSGIQDVTPSELRELSKKLLILLNSKYAESCSDIEENVLDVAEAFSDAEDTLAAELSYRSNEFQPVIDTADAQGTDYDHCQKFVDKFWTLTEVFYPGLMYCINTTSKTDISIFDEYTANLTLLYTNIPNITAEIDSCESTNQTCLEQINGEINQLNSTIPQKFIEISVKSNSTANEYINTTPNCTERSNKELRVMARTLIAEFAECTGVKYDEE